MESTKSSIIKEFICLFKFVCHLRKGAGDRINLIISMKIYSQIKINHFCPVFLKTLKGDKIRSDFHKNYFYKSWAMLCLIPKLKNIIKKDSIDTIHIIDNYGPFMSFLKLFFPGIKIIGTAVTYNPTSNLYNLFLKWSFSKFDQIISFSDSFEKVLRKLGFRNVETIHWGIIPSKKIHTKKYNLIKILWTGYLQQTHEKDFVYSINIAKKIIYDNPLIEFDFIFKPEHFNSIFLKYSQKGITIKQSSGMNFKSELRNYNFLLCPILNLNSTLAPPLTWIECLNVGIPVITTPRKNIEEIIYHKFNGFIIKDNFEELVKFLNSDKKILNKNCNRFIKTNYNLNQSALNYQKLWEKN